MSSRVLRIALTGILFVTPAAMLGCRTDAPGSRTRDSAGVRIIEHAVTDSLPRWRADPQPRLRLGGVEGEESQQLFNVAGAVRLSDGRIVVANGGTSELRWFGRDGRHLLTAGRSGGGPGEFRRILRLFRVAGDSMLVIDPAAARLSVFDDSGRFVRAFPVGRLPQGQPTIRARFGDGRLLGFILNPDVGTHRGLHVQRATFLILSDSGTVVDSIGTFAVNEGEARVTERGQSVYYWPFHANGFAGVTGDRIVYAWSRTPEIRLHSATGALEQIVRLPARPREFTAEMRREEGERVAATRPPTLRPLFLRDWGAMDFPDSLPVYSAMLVDLTGSIWLQILELGDIPERRWLVMNPETGNLEADVMLPGRLRAFEIGDDYVLGTIRDDLGVESVILLDLSRAPDQAR